MATTGAGTPYVESSDLVANYPAVSESLAERVDLVGVLPFADSTARGTAIPSPTDGQYSYLQDTNATEYWNGSAWVAAGVAPGLVHINTTTFSAVSSVSLDNVFTSAYDNYRIMLTSNLSSSGADASFRLRVSGSDNTTSNSYISQRLSASNTLVAGVRTTSNTWAIWQLNSTRINGIVFDIFNPFVNGTTAIQSVVASSDTGAYFATYVGTHTQSASYDGFTIYPDLNNITGTIRVYGYKNS